MEAGKSPRTVALLVTLFSLLTAMTVLGFAIGWRTEIASKEGGGIDAVLTYLLVSTGVLVVLGHGVLCWFLLKSDPAGAATGRPSRRAEWMWSLIPVLIMSVLSEAGVLVVGSPVWHSMYAEEPEDPVIVEIVAKQFEWYARYPGKDGRFGAFNLEDVDGQDNRLGLDEDDEAAADDVVKTGVLTLPVGRPALLRLRTHDVIHSFFVPQFRLKQDLLPGMVTRLKVTPTRTGEFDLVCAELCGIMHFKMQGRVVVLSEDEFDAWLAKQETFGG